MKCGSMELVSLNAKCPCFVLSQFNVYIIYGHLPMPSVAFMNLTREQKHTFNESHLALFCRNANVTWIEQVAADGWIGGQIW